MLYVLKGGRKTKAKRKEIKSGGGGGSEMIMPVHEKGRKRTNLQEIYDPAILWMDSPIYHAIDKSPSTIQASW